jgi:hypothetical protein
MTSTFRRYNIPSINGEGWAVVVLDLKDGYFSTVSDWGNYSYMWTNIGTGLDFRQFLCSTAPESFWGKITQGREAWVWNIEATQKAMQLALDGMLVAGEVSTEVMGEARDLLSSVEDWSSLESWTSDLELDYQDWVDAPVFKREEQSWSFVEKVLPRLRVLMQEEMAAEKR